MWFLALPSLHPYTFLENVFHTLIIRIAQVTRHQPCTFENSSFHFHYYIAKCLLQLRSCTIIQFSCTIKFYYSLPPKLEYTLNHLCSNKIRVLHVMYTLQYRKDYLHLWLVLLRKVLRDCRGKLYLYASRLVTREFPTPTLQMPVDVLAKLSQQ